MKHVKVFESSNILSMNVNPKYLTDMLGPDDLKYTVYINKNGSGKVLNNIDNQFEFIFSNIIELCEGLQLRNNTSKYNL